MIDITLQGEWKIKNSLYLSQKFGPFYLVKKHPNSPRTLQLVNSYVILNGKKQVWCGSVYHWLCQWIKNYKGFSAMLTDYWTFNNNNKKQKPNLTSTFYSLIWFHGPKRNAYWCLVNHQRKLGQQVGSSRRSMECCCWECRTSTGDASQPGLVSKHGKGKPLCSSNKMIDAVVFYYS